ncbi:hypothetical protein D5086_017303 [Populus alba]|uniref:Uncharacterized protein n=1 Tax=Populus alba TaxID=43335 RepID=A0ACC4BX20_POPAL
MVKKTMEGSLSFCFSIGVPSKTAVALLLMTYCLLIVTTVGAASSLVVRLAPKAAILDLFAFRGVTFHNINSSSNCPWCKSSRYFFFFRNGPWIQVR